MEKYCPQCFKRFPENEVRCPEDDTRLVAVGEEDLLGAVIDDRYKILDCIGKGGMGVVYRAKQTMIGRIVALKVLRKDVVQDESSVKRFMTEAKAMGDLKSAHTMTLHDFGVTSDGLLYYTMDFLDGRPLSKIVEQDGPMAIGRVVDLMMQACDSLEEAHDHGILHRDIKPDNMFVTLRRGKEHVTVLDFGIAKLAGDVGGDKITKTGMICGTPAYLAPEQVLYAKASPASDLYSLGIVFYECICGMAPFQDATPIGLLMKHVNEAVRPVSEVNPKVTVPAAVDGFLVRALAKNPDQRFASIAEFRAAMLEACTSATPSQLQVPAPALATMDGGHRALKTTVPYSEPVAPAAEPSGIGAAIPDNASLEMAWSPARSSSKWVKVGVAAGLVGVVLVALLVWAPWKSSEGETDSGTQTTPGDSAQSTAKGVPVAGSGEGNAVPGISADVSASADRVAGGSKDVAAETTAPDVVSAPLTPDVTGGSGVAGPPDVRVEIVPEAAAAPEQGDVTEMVGAVPAVPPEVVAADVASEVKEDSPVDRKGDRTGDRKGDRKTDGKGGRKGGGTSGKDETGDKGTVKEPLDGTKQGDDTKVPEDKKPEEKGLEFRKPTDGFRRPTLDNRTEEP